MAAERIALVTGASGYIGTQLCATWRARWPTAPLHTLSRRRCASPDMAATHSALDLAEPGAVADLIRQLQPSVIWHLVGLIHSPDWQALYRANVLTTLNLLQAVADAGSQARVVLAGSAAEYGLVEALALPVTEAFTPRPVLPYGVTKAWQTTLARSFAARGLNVVVARIFNVVGAAAPASTSLGAFAQQIRAIRDHAAPPHLAVGNLSPRRDFVDIHDIAEALLAVADRGQAGAAYNICSGHSVPVGQALQQLIALAGVAVDVRVDRARLRPVDVSDIYGSLVAITGDTGWAPRVALDASLRAMLT